MNSQSDVVEIRLKDNRFTTYWKQKCEVNNKKALRKLFFSDLKAKGIDLGKVKDFDDEWFA